MIQLNDEQVLYIRKRLQDRLVQNETLREELTDHLCILTEMEMNNGLSFTDAYSKAVSSFGHSSFRKIENDFFHITGFQKLITPGILLIIAGISIIIILVGTWMHIQNLYLHGWIFGIGFLLLAYLFLPLLFLYFYEKVVHRFLLVLGFVTTFFGCHAIVLLVLQIRPRRFIVPIGITIILLLLIYTICQKMILKAKKIIPDKHTVSV